MAKKIAVELGRDDGLRTEIVSGLSGGESVILAGKDLVAKGDSVASALCLPRSCWNAGTWMAGHEACTRDVETRSVTWSPTLCATSSIGSCHIEWLEEDAVKLWQSLESSTRSLAVGLAILLLVALNGCPEPVNVNETLRS